MSEDKAEYRVYSDSLTFISVLIHCLVQWVVHKISRPVSQSYLCVSHHYFTFPLLLCLTAFPLTDLSNVVFSIMEPTEFLLLFPFYLCFCLFLISLLLITLLKKEFRAAEVKVRLYLSAIVSVHTLFCRYPHFPHISFFPVALQTGVFTELHKTNPTLGFFFTWLNKFSFNLRKYVWWMNHPNIHCVALLYSLYLV